VKRRSSPAFTLLEILLAIALIALLTAALVGGSVSMLRDRPSTPEEMFWQVTQQARKAALTETVEVRLSWDEEHKSFVVDDGTTPQNVAMPPSSPPDVGVDFAPSDGTDQSLMAGSIFTQDKLPYVSFYPDGTCTAFQVQIRGHGTSHVIPIDPWTCAAILKAPTTP
jgi:Tfp pilus assembly protein FimT